MLLEIIILSLLGVILAIVIWATLTINGFFKMIKHIEEAEKNLEQALNKRCQLFQEVYTLSKTYITHEHEFLKQVCDTQLSNDDKAFDLKQSFSDQLMKGFQILFRVIENQVELSNDTKISKLIDLSIENDEQIQASKRIYNTYVSQYNQKVVVFPSHLIARMKQYEKRPFYEVDSIHNEETLKT